MRGPDVISRYGLRQGPHLLGLSYTAAAVRTRAARELADSQGLGNRALDLITDTFAAVATDNHDDLTAALGVVARQVAAWQADLTDQVNTGDPGPICVDPRCPAGRAHYGPCPGPHRVDTASEAGKVYRWTTGPAASCNWCPHPFHLPAACNRTDDAAGPCVCGSEAAS